MFLLLLDTPFHVAKYRKPINSPLYICIYVESSSSRIIFKTCAFSKLIKVALKKDSLQTCYLALLQIWQINVNFSWVKSSAWKS